MRWPTRSEGAALALLVATAACASRSAGVSRTLGPGPLRVDPDRRVAVTTSSGDSIMDVGVPFLGNRTLGAINRCTAQAFWLGEALRDSILSQDPDVVIPRLRADPRFEFVEILDGFAAPIPGRLDASLVADRVTFRSPSAAAFVDPADNLGASLLFEMWFGPGPTATGACPAPDPGRASTFYLLDFETIRPAGSSATGLATLVVAIVAITSLVAIGVGPP